MAENSSIEWTDHTFNPWYGCTKVSPGCDHCYAEARMDTRLHRVQWGAGQPRVRTKDWGDPGRWNRQHEAFFAAHGRRQRVFCASLADVFDNEVPAQWRADLLDLIAQTPNLDWLLLTKRIGNAHRMVSEALVALGNAEPGVLRRWPLPNVWLGATIVNQEEADRDIPKLLATPARVRFLSMEPLLGPVDLNYTCMRIQAARGQLARAINGETWLDWVIVGGESGHGARPAHVQWMRSIVEQCRAASVPVLVKQLGPAILDDGMSSPGQHWPMTTVRQPVPRRVEADPGFIVRMRDRKGGDWSEWPEDLRVREFPEAPHG